MNIEQIKAYQQERDRFMSTPVGKALNTFRNASAAMWKEDGNESISYARLKRLDEAYKAADEALTIEIKKLLGWISD